MRTFAGTWLTRLAAAMVATLFARAADPAVSLPAVTVNAEVPLIKVAELSMLEPRLGPAAVVHDGYIYIVGGLNRDDVPSRTIERFEIKSGRSEIFAHLKFPRFWHGAVTNGGKLYVIGGAMLSIGESLPADPKAAEQLTKAAPSSGARLPWMPIRFVEVVDLQTGAIEHGPPLLKPVYSFGCVGVSDQIAVIGGNAGAAVAATPSPLDQPVVIGSAPLPTTKRGRMRDLRNAVEAGQAPPAAVRRTPSAPVRAPTPAAPTDRLSIYDPAKGGWTLGPPLPRARQTAAVVQGPFVIAAGGYTPGGPLTNVDVFDLRTGAWRSAKPLRRATSAHSMVVLDHWMFLFGDYTHPDELLAYDLRTEASEVFTLGYTPTRHTAAVTHDRRIYVIGGRPSRVENPLKAIQVFALRKDVKSADTR